jgi:radical SAM protein with 4Fe4S-binding SPASM domain
MENRRIKNIKLSPFVYKVKGCKNYAFYDLLKGKLHRVNSEMGELKKLINDLLKAEIVIETEGVIPFKFSLNMSHYKEKTKLRELQIRVTGACDENCSICGDQPCCCYKGEKEMDEKIVSTVIEQTKDISISHILITGGNPFKNKEKLLSIRNGIIADQYSVLFKGLIETDDQSFLEMNGIHLKTRGYSELEINESNMILDFFSFFYNHYFNPCWGNKLGIDVDGTIRPCLWSQETPGNILEKDIRDLILDGEFDKYWELKKDDIKICKECEYRYACSDCRVEAVRQGGLFDSKTAGCKYDPVEGVW